jgi:hypothetical protein
MDGMSDRAEKSVLLYEHYQSSISPEIAPMHEIRIQGEGNTNIYIRAPLHKALRKNMRNIVHAVFMIGLLISLCFCCACTSQSPSQEQAGTVPPVSTTPTPIPGLSAASSGVSGSTTSFDKVKISLDNYNPGSSDSATVEKKVYRLHGKGMDESGAAAIWIFTSYIDNTNQLLTYDGSSWRNTTISSGDFPAAIDFNRIITPAELFSRNRQTLFPAERPGTEVTRDLDLTNSVYTVTITSGNDIKVYRFNATTGVLIS